MADGKQIDMRHRKRDSRTGAVARDGTRASLTEKPVPEPRRPVRQGPLEKQNLGKWEDAQRNTLPGLGSRGPGLGGPTVCACGLTARGATGVSPV